MNKSLDRTSRSIQSTERGYRQWQQLTVSTSFRLWYKVHCQINFFHAPPSSSPRVGASSQKIRGSVPFSKFRQFFLVLVCAEIPGISSDSQKFRRFFFEFFVLPFLRCLLSFALCAPVRPTRRLHQEPSVRTTCQISTRSLTHSSSITTPPMRKTARV